MGEQLDQARRVIEKILPELDLNHFEVEIKGMDSFGENIVFAEVDQGRDILRKIHEHFLDAFEAEGFGCDQRFTPHTTIMRAGEQIPREYYDQFQEKNFGSQTVSEISFLSMSKPESADGYYYSEGDFKFEDFKDGGIS